MPVEKRTPKTGNTLRPKARSRLLRTRLRGVRGRIAPEVLETAPLAGFRTATGVLLSAYISPAMSMFRNLGTTIRLLRELRGYSQAALARRAGMGKSQLSKYEQGH